MRLADSARGSLHCIGDLSLRLRVGDVDRPLRMRDSTQNLSIDWVSQNASESLNPYCGLLIDRSSLYNRRPRTSRGVGLACGVLFRQRPVRKLWELDRLAVLVERNPHLGEVVEIAAQPETDAAPFESLCFRRSKRILLIGPLFSAARMTAQSSDGERAGHHHLAGLDRL